MPTFDFPLPLSAQPTFLAAGDGFHLIFCFSVECPQEATLTATEPPPPRDLTLRTPSSSSTTRCCRKSGTRPGRSDVLGEYSVLSSSAHQSRQQEANLLSFSARSIIHFAGSICISEGREEWRVSYLYFCHKTWVAQGAHLQIVDQRPTLWSSLLRIKS